MMLDNLCVDNKSANDAAPLVSLDDVRCAAGLIYEVEVQPNPYFSQTAEWTLVTWETLIEVGKAYLVGDKITTKEFVRRHTTRLVTWQGFAVVWALENPKQQLTVESSAWHQGPDRCYVIRARGFADPSGPCVEIGLPYHGQGGERHWITRNAKTRVLVNVD